MLIAAGGGLLGIATGIAYFGAPAYPYLGTICVISAMVFIGAGSILWVLLIRENRKLKGYGTAAQNYLNNQVKRAELEIAEMKAEKYKELLAVSEAERGFLENELQSRSDVNR